MGNYANKRTYINIPAKTDEELVSVLAYDLVNWKNDCIKNGKSDSKELIAENLNQLSLRLKSCLEKLNDHKLER